MWHNPTEVTLEGKRIVVTEDDRRYPDPRKTEFPIDRLSIEIRAKPRVLENGVEIWGSLFLREKGGNWLTRVLNTLAGRKEVRFEASERAAFEKLCQEAGCPPS